MDSKLESWTRRAVNGYREGDKHRWVACLAASHVVGRYARGATIDLARELKISPGHVITMARAGETYRIMRRYCPDLPEIRRALTHSHFAVMGERMRRWDIPMREAIEQMRTAATEGASVVSLATALDGEYGNDYDDVIRRKIEATRSMCESLSNLIGDPKPGTYEETVSLACQEFILATEV